MGKIWTVCSGSGGVGKTMIALAMSVGAAKAGKKTILLDASGTARACDLILGMESMMTLDMGDVLRSQIRMEAAIYPVAQYANLYLTCASVNEPVPVCELSGMILALHSMCDVLVIDMPTGQCFLGRGVMRVSDEYLFITRPDNPSIRSTERLLLRTRDSGVPASSRLIINRIIRDRVKHKTQYTQSTVESLLDMPADACIPEDPSIPECECSARAAIECNGPAWSVLSTLCKNLLNGA